MKVRFNRPLKSVKGAGGRAVLIAALLATSLLATGCESEQTAQVSLAIGTVQKIQYRFAGWNDNTEVDTTQLSILVKGVAPLPFHTALELRGSKLHATHLCVVTTQRCWELHIPASHEWSLLSSKP